MRFMLEIEIRSNEFFYFYIIYLLLLLVYKYIYCVNLHFILYYIYYIVALSNPSNLVTNKWRTKKKNIKSNKRDFLTT